MPKNKDSQPKSPQNKKQTVTEEQWCELMFKWTTWIRKENMMLTYYAKINPYRLSVKEWALRVTELRWIRHEESKTKEQ